MKKHRLRDERGQAAIFMALFVSTMIMLFAFTTNIGMLVHAKINLQNAADAAAYAGAAVQARQLTNAAYLNWEMRRALKEFLYYYTIRSQYAAMPCFPTNAAGRSIPQCAPVPADVRHPFRFEDPREGNNEQGGPYLPSVCIIFDPNNNYCQKAGVPGIPEFPAGGSWGVADPIVAAVRSATADIIMKKTADCEGRTDINRKFMIDWLFNLYPTSFERMTGKDSADPFPYVDGLERLGVLPRMALLRGRLDNVEEALNMNLVNENLGTVTDETMGSLRSIAPPGSAKTLDYFERPIQAFLSARNNLPTVEEHNGNFSNIELTELLPSSGVGVEANPFLKNPPVLAKFNDLWARATFANSLFREKKGGGDDRGNCYQVREERVIPRFPFGVTKDPTVPTYYAVRLQARARLLFSPFGSDGTVTLSAYSVAKPFGSRVGKNLDPENGDTSKRQMMVASALRGADFNGSGGMVTINFPLGSTFAPTFPNPLVADNDTVSQSQGFTRQGHLGYIRGATLLLNRLDLGPRLAGAYAPWEIGYYTPPASYPQQVAGAIKGMFEDNPLFGTLDQEGKFFAMQAPIFPVNGDGAGDLTFLRDKVGSYLSGTIADADTIKKGAFYQFLMGDGSDPDSGVLTDAKWEVLQQYLKASRQIYLHYIPDPMLTDEPELQAYARAEGRRYTVAGMPDPYKRQLTSWNNQKTAADAGDANFNIPENSELGLNIGRSGYSVRFMSFAALKAGGLGTNDPRDQKEWTNPLERFTIPDPEVSKRVTDDVNKIKH